MCIEPECIYIEDPWNDWTFLYNLRFLKPRLRFSKHAKRVRWHADMVCLRKWNKLFVYLRPCWKGSLRFLAAKVKVGASSGRGVVHVFSSSLSTWSRGGRMVISPRRKIYLREDQVSYVILFSARGPGKFSQSMRTSFHLRAVGVVMFSNRWRCWTCVKIIPIIKL